MPTKKRSRSNAPATKGDLSNLRSELKQFMEDRFERQEQLLELRLQQQTKELEYRLQQHTDELKRHFSVVIENAYADLVGANKDKISLLVNYHDNHEQRIVSLERKIN